MSYMSDIEEVPRFERVPHFDPSDGCDCKRNPTDFEIFSVLFGCPAFVQTILVGLKVAGVIEAGWWWVWSPVWAVALWIGMVFCVGGTCERLFWSGRKCRWKK